MDRICYERVRDSLQEGHQVMVFVHSRRGTSLTADRLREYANRHGTLGLFTPFGPDAADGGAAATAHHRLAPAFAKSRNQDARKLFDCGLGCHHAGMSRPDRSLTEKGFAEGAIRVLCCTATLAWGVNLPAHTVIIKGTEVYVQKGAAAAAATGTTATPGLRSCCARHDRAPADVPPLLPHYSSCCYYLTTAN